MPTEPWMAYTPEINATRINGPGAFSWSTAASTWSQLALATAAAKRTFEAQNAIQTATIDGAGSEAIAAKTAPFAAWLDEMEAAAKRASHENHAIGESWVQARTTMVPNPVIQANRAAFALATNAAFAAPALAGEVVRLESEYASYWTKNAATMTAYDEAVSAASLPRVYPHPPQLNAGMDGVAPASGAVAQVQSAIQSATSSIPSSVNDALAGLPVSVGQTPGQVSAAMQSAGATASQVMGQMATPVGGVTATGLGGGAGAAMSPLQSGLSAGSRSVPFGGLPLTSAPGVAGMPAGAGAAGGAAGRAMPLFTSPAMTGAVGAGGAGGAGSASGMRGGVGVAGGAGGASGMRGGIGAGSGSTALSALGAGSGASGSGAASVRGVGAGAGAAALRGGLGAGSGAGAMRGMGASLGGARLGMAFPGVPLGESASTGSSSAPASAARSAGAGAGAGYGAPVGASQQQRKSEKAAGGYKSSAAESIDDPFADEQERAEQMKMFR